jgi:type I restriction enzyme S subunit
VSDLQASKRYALNGGPFGSKLVSKNYVPEGVPVIRGANLPEDSRFSMSDFVFVSASKADELLPNNAHPGDLVFTQRGTLGQVGLIPRTSPFRRFVISQSQMKLTVDEKKADATFLYYYFRAPRTVQQIHNLAFSTGVPHINLDILRNFEVRLPLLPAQKRIRAILSTYDDLIENNVRRIKILEEMAQAIYREWFVHFRFPGHKKDKLVNSPLGPIPQGWHVKRVTDAIAVDPPTPVVKEGEKPFVPMSSLANDSMLIHEVELRSGNSGSKFKNGDTLLARITPSLENGKTAFVQFLPADEDVGLGSTEFIVLRSKTLCPEFVYLLARSSEFRNNAIKSMSGATGRQRVQSACFNTFAFAHPDQQTTEAFADQVSPMFQAIRILAAKTHNLRRTRDLLLPKLISGGLDVSGLDIKVEGLA